MEYDVDELGCVVHGAAVHHPSVPLNPSQTEQFQLRGAHSTQAAALDFEDSDAVALIEQRSDEARSDEPGSASNQGRLHVCCHPASPAAPTHGPEGSGHS